MKRKFKQWWSSTPPILSKRTITFHLNWTHWIQKRSRHMMLEIHVLAWDRHKNVAELIRYSRACESYHDFLDRKLLLTRNLLNELVKLKKSSLKSFTVGTITWLTVREYLCHKCPRICSVCRNHYPVPSSFMTYHRVCNRSNTTGATCGPGTAYPSRTHGFVLLNL
jgi:hypothetical protein